MHSINTRIRRYIEIYLPFLCNIYISFACSGNQLNSMLFIKLRSLQHNGPLVQKFIDFKFLIEKRNQRKYDREFKSLEVIFSMI